MTSSFLIIIVLHELGHAVAIKASGLGVLGIDLTGIGGKCRWRGRASELERAWIAWCGVLAQSFLLCAALLARAIWGTPRGHAGMLLSEAFVGINVWIMILNLIPVPPLDGAEAWRLFGELRRAGWTPTGAAARALHRWVQARRAARVSAHSGEPEDAAQSTTAAPVSSPMAEAGAELSARPEPDAPMPSAQAQRELAALLERIGQEAGKTKRRR